jgi:hypothetical protein
MVRALRVVSTPDDGRTRAPDLRDVVTSALDAMSWLSASDEAMKTLALRQAQEIEQAIDRAQELSDLYESGAGDRSVYDRLKKLEAFCEVTRVVATVGPQLQAVLRDLGGSPATRRALAPSDEVGSRLKTLRNAARPA